MCPLEVLLETMEVRSLSRQAEERNQVEHYC